jgi:hypothetical protein
MLALKTPVPMEASLTVYLIVAVAAAAVAAMSAQRGRSSSYLAAPATRKDGTMWSDGASKASRRPCVRVDEARSSSSLNRLLEGAPCFNLLYSLTALNLEPDLIFTMPS